MSRLSYTILFSELDDDAILRMISEQDESMTDDYSVTPLTAAVHIGRANLVEALLERGFSPLTKSYITSPFGAAISSKHRDADKILTLLISRSGRFSEESPAQYCPELNEPMLHAAIRRNRVTMIEHLMKNGINPEWQDTDGQSALALANELNIILNPRANL